MLAALAVVCIGPGAGAAHAQELSVADVATTNEGDGREGTTASGGTHRTITFTVTLAPAAAQEVTVDYTTTSFEAVSPADFTATSGELSFAPGETTKPVTVTVIGDASDEEDEAFRLTLSDPQNASPGDMVGEATIVDDDDPPAISISDGAIGPPGLEGTGINRTMAFSVQLSAPSGKAISVAYTTEDFEATSPSDYSSTAGVLIFDPGETTEVVNVTVVGDAIDEDNERLRVRISDPTNASLGDAVADGTIVDDDTAQVSVSDGTPLPPGLEGTGANSTMRFTISLAVASTKVVTVDYTTTGLQALSPDDFTATSGQLTFQPGETTKTVDVTVVGDPLDEFNETFRLTASLPAGSNASPGDMVGEGAIVDDDDPPTLTIADGVIPNPGVEGTAGNRIMEFAVKLSAPTAKTVTVHYETLPGSATAPADYDHKTTIGGTPLTFAAGATTRTIQIIIKGDAIDEIDETFGVKLTNATNATPTDDEAVGTIVDDDGPKITISDVTVTEGPPGGAAIANFQVSLSAPSPQPVSFAYASQNDTATAPDDYDAIPANQRMTIPAGSQAGSIPVTVRGDDLDEADEKLRVNLDAATNGTLTGDGTDKQGVATITDDDAAPALVVGNGTVAEGTGGASAAWLPVSLSRPSGRALAIAYATADGSATAGSDYEAAATSVTFNAGETAKQVAIPLGADGDVEEDETFTVSFTDPETGRAVPITVTIADDDVTTSNMPRVSVRDATVREGNTGTTEAVFLVRLDRTLARTVTVRYATADRRGKAGQDYTPVDGRLAFAPGETSKQVSVPVIGDTAIEFNQDFRLLLSDPVNARLGDASGLGIIIDDDAGLDRASVAPKTLRATRVLCLRGRKCAGLLTRWTVRRAGTIRVDVTASVRRRVKGKSSQSRRTRTQVLKLASRKITVKRGSGKARVKRARGRTASRMMRRVRAAKVRTMRVKVTFTNRQGAQQVERFVLKLRR